MNDTDFAPGDILLSEASGSASEVGKPAIWRDEIPGCCYQKTLLRVRPVSAGASCDWLYLAFLADALLGRFASMALGVGIVPLTADRMFSWPVPLAPLPEQQRIIALTRAAFQHRDALERLTLQAAASAVALDRAILAKAFRGELVSQDSDDESAEVMLARLGGVGDLHHSVTPPKHAKKRWRSGT